MWSPDMPPFNVTPLLADGGEGGGGVTACLTGWRPWNCGTCVSHAHASAHSSRPSSIPFSRSLSLCPSLFACPSAILPFPCAAPVCRTPHSEMTPKTVGKLLRKCITACHFDTLWRFPHYAPLHLPLPSSARSLCSLNLAIGHATSKQWLQLATTTTRVAQTVCKASTSCQLTRTNRRNQVKI